MSEFPNPEDEVSTAGWDAIAAELERLYPGQEPKHWGTLLSYRIGGNDPLDGISVYAHNEGELPHWHYVSFGFSELYSKELEDKETSGFGFELTFRLRRDAAESEPPQWPLSLMQSLARYVFKSGNVLAVGDYVPLNGPIALGKQTAIHAAMFVEDPELGAIDSPNGRVQFRQLVGTTLDELAAARAWDTTKLLELMRRTDPLLVTDLSRQSILADPQIAREVEQATALDGSSSAWLMVRELRVISDLSTRQPGIITLVIGASSVRDIKSVLLGRIPFGRSLQIVGTDASVEFSPAANFAWRMSADDRCTIELSSDIARNLAAALLPKRGDYAIPAIPQVSFRVVPTQIMDPTGKQVVEVIG